MMFVERAGRLAGVAGAMFGWGPDLFWNATPAELLALVQAVSGDGAAPLAGGEFARLKEMFPDG
ncbi:phage tail assembly chaperone [Sphingomonas sp. AOB5]|uniref:phage tail assembly chaperone n=1 Tax=Sphingomonas sp. AOB5 TaxID=3034017 RepID=UPI0023F9B565|nr:phage tail assembly chaperone [Sphingomonas sp. AOB5]MDF7777799.1 phage tail assembly chaperone [Sphingomonas sp. AOB5]